MTAFPRVSHEDVRNLGVEAWCRRLEQSASDPIQDDVRYPGFPDEAVQRQFVGSAGADALREISQFYRLIQTHIWPRDRERGRYLDFGSGWARVSRFFLRDFREGEMVGVDIDPDMVAFCRTSNQPGAYFAVDPQGALPFAPGTFGVITAYSVFTHLPPKIFATRLHDLIALLAPGGLLVITVEPPRFIDFIDSIPPETDQAWWASLARQRHQVPRLRADLAAGGIAYLASGGGEYRDQDIYGETVVTADYVRKAVRPLGQLVEFVDDPQQFWQAVAIIRRHDPVRNLWNHLLRTTTWLRRLARRLRRIW